MQKSTEQGRRYTIPDDHPPQLNNPMLSFTLPFNHNGYLNYSTLSYKNHPPLFPILRSQKKNKSKENPSASYSFEKFNLGQHYVNYVNSQTDPQTWSARRD